MYDVLPTMYVVGDNYMVQTVVMPSSPSRASGGYREILRKPTTEEWEVTSWSRIAHVSFLANIQSTKPVSELPHRQTLICQPIFRGWVGTGTIARLLPIGLFVEYTRRVVPAEAGSLEPVCVFGTLPRATCWEAWFVIRWPVLQIGGQRMTGSYLQLLSLVLYSHFRQPYWVRWTANITLLSWSALHFNLTIRARCRACRALLLLLQTTPVERCIHRRFPWSRGRSVDGCRVSM